MKKVLLITLILTLVALLINGLRYLSMPSGLNREVVMAIGVLALMAAIPVTLGYIFAHLCLRSSHPILVGLKLILFLVNGLLIIGTTMLTFYVIFEEADALVSVPYLIAGIYTYYETVKLIRQPPNPEAQGLSDNDVLDDFFIDSK